MSFYDWDTMQPDEITDLYQRKLALAENMSVARIEVKQGAVTQMHRHDNEEIICVLKGEWRFCLPQGDVVVGPNQVLAIPRGVEHSSEALDDVVAIDICERVRMDWLTGEDRSLHHDPDDFLWAV